MVYVLSVTAALSNALTSVFQRMGVEDAPEDATMRLSLMAHAIRRGVWLMGFGFMVLSFLLQSVALHLGTLSVGPPYFNPSFLVPMLPMLALLALGIHARWRRGGLSQAPGSCRRSTSGPLQFLWVSHSPPSPAWLMSRRPYSAV